MTLMVPQTSTKKVKMTPKDNQITQIKKSFILSNSMIKHTKGLDLSSKTDHKHSIFVRSFSRAKARSMRDYVKPYAKDDYPDHIIVHVRTNDLNSESNLRRAAESTANLTEGLISEKRLKFLESYPEMTNGKKGRGTKSHFKAMCKIALINYIDSSSFNPKKHLNNSKLHLNEKGPHKLNSIFLNNITTLCKH